MLRDFAGVNERDAVSLQEFPHQTGEGGPRHWQFWEDSGLGMA